MSTSTLALSKAKYKNQATKKASKILYADRGTSGANKIQEIQSAANDKFVEDYENVKRYGKDAMKGRGFATTGRPKAVNANKKRKK